MIFKVHYSRNIVPSNMRSTSSTSHRVLWISRNACTDKADFVGFRKDPIQDDACVTGKRRGLQCGEAHGKGCLCENSRRNVRFRPYSLVNMMASKTICDFLSSWTDNLAKDGIYY